MQLFKSIKKWLQKPVRFDIIGKYLKPGKRFLDVGCGDFAPYSTLEYYPGLLFSGIDWHDIPGKKDMDLFHQGDLENNPLTEIPNNYYDVINLSHIIEHITNGEFLIQQLVSKLKPGGVIYIETPSERSLRLPSMYGTLNFFDDSTHKKVYTLTELKNILIRSNCSVVTAKKRHNLKRILLMPLYFILSIIRDKKINATVIWDITGFAHYVVAQKK